MKSYLDLLRLVRDHGVRKPTRAKLLSTGEHVHAVSVFGAQWRHNLREGFPALTTKKIAFKSVAVELAWFLRGDTNVKYLQDHGVTIWNEWSTKEQCAKFGREEGDLGPTYSKQWRDFGAHWHPYTHGEVPTREAGVDQIAHLIENIESVKKDPFHASARRLIVTAWDPRNATSVALPPCHTLFQFGVTNGSLSCSLYMRSADALLGVPFNIASYALLTHLVAAATGLEVGELVVSYADLHIYENHMAQVEEQLSREPKPLPWISLGLDLGQDLSGDLRNFDPLLVKLVGYDHHPAIKAEVAV